MTASNQRYLKAVYVLSEREGSTRIVDIADALSVSKASVCGAMRKLSDMGYVAHELYGDIKLTEEGEKRARAMIASYERLKKSLGEESPLPDGLAYLLGGAG